jgi:hypothetical protein
MDKIFQLEWPLWVLYGIAILLSLYLASRMRRKGLDPYPTRTKLEKHQKTIDKFTNIIIVGGAIFVLATAINIIYLLRPQKIGSPTVPLDEKTQELSIGIICMLLGSFLCIIAFFIGMMTTFQKNLTKMKRIVLSIISILPVLFLISWFFIDDATASSTKCSFALGYFFIVGIINGPGIVCGTSFFELAEKIRNKFTHKIQQN